MPNELVVVNNTSPAAVKESGENYSLALHDGRKFVLLRDMHFGKPHAKLKQPILYKAGAEYVRWEYGCLDRYTILESVQDFATGFFMYTFKCELVKFIDGVPIVVAEGYGSANTRELNVGNASGFDVANTKLKIAEKRSLVDAVLKMARLSAIFTQDLENDDFMNQSGTITKGNPDGAITSKQRQRLFAIAANVGLSTEQCRNYLKSIGFASTKDIKTADFDELCEKLKGLSNGTSNKT